MNSAFYDGKNRFQYSFAFKDNFIVPKSKHRITRRI